jgi:hypothetical protein
MRRRRRKKMKKIMRGENRPRIRGVSGGGDIGG